MSSLNWQHQLCKNPRPNPDIKTLFVDHSCGPQNGARAPPAASNSLVGGLPKQGAFPPLAHGVSHLVAFCEMKNILSLLCPCTVLYYIILEGVSVFCFDVLQHVVCSCFLFLVCLLF